MIDTQDFSRDAVVAHLEEAVRKALTDWEERSVRGAAIQVASAFKRAVSGLEVLIAKTDVAACRGAVGQRIIPELEADLRRLAPTETQLRATARVFEALHSAAEGLPHEAVWPEPPGSASWPVRMTRKLFSVSEDRTVTVRPALEGHTVAAVHAPHELVSLASPLLEQTVIGMSRAVKELTALWHALLGTEHDPAMWESGLSSRIREAAARIMAAERDILAAAEACNVHAARMVLSDVIRRRLLEDGGRRAGVRSSLPGPTVSSIDSDLWNH